MTVVVPPFGGDAGEIADGTVDAVGADEEACGDFGRGWGEVC